MTDNRLEPSSESGDSSLAERGLVGTELCAGCIRLVLGEEEELTTEWEEHLIEEAELTTGWEELTNLPPFKQ